MSQVNNVIDITKKFKNKKSKTEGTKKAQAPLIDMTERRNAIMVEERRLVKRTILTEFVGAFVVVPEAGLLRVAIYDISDDGIAFDVTEEQGCFKMGEEIAIRVYLNQHTYFPFTVKANNIRAINEEGVVRHGCSFLKDTVNLEALHHFVKFIETISASLESDHGDIVVSKINSL